MGESCHCVGTNWSQLETALHGGPIRAAIRWYTASVYRPPLQEWVRVCDVGSFPVVVTRRRARYATDALPATIGSVNSNVLPRSHSEVAVMVPPINSTRFRQMDRPRPVPLCFLLNDESSC